MNTKSKIIFASVLACSLMACKESNPLESKDKTKVASFLVNASIYAENKLNVENKRALKGKVYGACMERHLKNIDCDKFYLAMTEYAKQEKKYPTLSVANIKSKSFFEGIKPFYDKEAFYTI